MVFFIFFSNIGNEISFDFLSDDSYDLFLVDLGFLGNYFLSDVSIFESKLSDACRYELPQHSPRPIDMRACSKRCPLHSTGGLFSSETDESPPSGGAGCETNDDERDKSKKR